MQDLPQIRFTVWPDASENFLVIAHQRAKMWTHERKRMLSLAVMGKIDESGKNRICKLPGISNVIWRSSCSENYST